MEARDCRYLANRSNGKSNLSLAGDRASRGGLNIKSSSSIFAGVTLFFSPT